MDLQFFIYAIVYGTIAVSAILGSLSVFYAGFWKKRKWLTVVMLDRISSKEYSFHKRFKISPSTSKFDVDKGDKKRFYVVDASKAIGLKPPLRMFIENTLFYNIKNSFPLSFNEFNKMKTDDGKYVYPDSQFIEVIVNLEVYKRVFKSKQAEKIYIYVIVGLIILIVGISVFAIWQIGDMNGKLIALATKLSQTVVQT